MTRTLLLRSWKWPLGGPLVASQGCSWSSATFGRGHCCGISNIRAVASFKYDHTATLVGSPSIRSGRVKLPNLGCPWLHANWHYRWARRMSGGFTIGNKLNDKGKGS